MKRMSKLGVSAVLGALFPFLPGPTDQTGIPYGKRIKTEPAKPRPQAIKDMSRKARKLYAKVLRETENHTLARKKAEEFEIAQAKGEV